MIPLLAVALAVLVMARVVAARSRPRVLERVRLGAGEIVVRELGGVREMVARAPRDRAQMIWSSRPPLPYVDALALAIAEGARRVLVLGCGGGSVVKRVLERAPGSAIDLVERDAIVVALAKRFFELPLDGRVRIHLSDATTFVHRDGAWDAAIVDVYGAMELPQAIASETFFSALAARIARGGRVAVNLVGALGDPLVARVIVAVEKAFGDLAVIPIPTEGGVDEPRNLVVLACRR